MRQAVLALVGLLVFPALARADYTVATVQRATPVSAYAGHVVWSQFEGGAFHLYEAHASPARLVTNALPVPPRAVPFDADIGPGADGTPTVVYSRCSREPRAGADGLPVWATGRGCDVYAFALGAAAEARVPGVSTGGASEFLPTIWRDHVGFARVYVGRNRLPYVYVRGDGPSERQPGGMRGDTGLPGPTSLDLAGVRLGLTWGATVNGDFRSDARLDTTTGGHTLLEFTTGQGVGNRVVSAFVFSGRVWWVHETTSGPQHVYRRWRISTEKLEQAEIPATRQRTLAIAPQSVSSVYWSKCGDAGCLIGGDGFANFVATL
ncbi:hypothetical protein OM076_22165 [Solirubrobacter ginsenosidimutans]|uniref:Uncharacterized protein n=1 Tax=Solirubrobacter ginsenosidimutans TaxID=490573 RepID=A0A9X3MUK9_9ACTN|nr:hypothetical protein [Solirubrobacter ginsenosidimutans]MDA0162994.1 hypothetical protein [Solirubrobacter ginsenosidimutans]